MKYKISMTILAILFFAFWMMTINYYQNRIVHDSTNLGSYFHLETDDNGQMTYNFDKKSWAIANGYTGQDAREILVTIDESELKQHWIFKVKKFIAFDNQPLEGGE